MAEKNDIALGAFSVSLAVKDLKNSKDFYEKLGFIEFGGDGENFVMMKHGTHVIGLFQGMFDKNILTFNPGWNQSGQESSDFTDIRDIENTLEKNGLELIKKTEAKQGPDSITLIDPDGNPVLIDQHR